VTFRCRGGVGIEYRPKHVEPFAGNKILYKVASCWNILILIHDARTHELKKNPVFVVVIIKNKVSDVKSPNEQVEPCIIVSDLPGFIIDY
jgi:hypothetical protein